MAELLKLKYFYIIVLLFVSLTVMATNKIYADQKIKIFADEILIDQNNRTINATGDAVAKDEKGSKITLE